MIPCSSLARILLQWTNCDLLAEPEGVISWDADALRQAMRLSEDEVREYFTDGRRISFLLERRINREFVHGTLAPSEGDRFDIIDPSNGRWEVRSITPATGVYFCPSNMVGAMRHFSEPGFLEKLDETAGFLLTDIESFPNVPFWRVTSQQVRHWWETRMLGAATRVSRTRALELLRRL